MNLYSYFKSHLRKKSDFSRFKLLVEKIFEQGSKNEFVKGERLLSNLFDTYFGDLPITFLYNYKDALYSIYKSSKVKIDFDKLQDFIENETYIIEDRKTIKFSTWVYLQYLSIRFGLFKNSYKFRCLAIKYLLKNANSSNQLNCFKAALDIGKYDLAFSILKNNINYFESESYKEMKNHYRLMKGYDISFRSIHRNNPYFDYVNNKNVAIVGPAPNKRNNGKEIDEFDIVARLGYKGKNFSKKIFGERTDISYYSIANFNLYLRKEKSNILSEIHYANFKNKKYLKYIDREYHPNSRTFIRNKYFLFGSPTMIQHAIYDILNFNPKRIKIFNTNFYLSNTPHYKEYMPTSCEKENYRKNSNFTYYNLWTDQVYDTGGFAHHDLISQINFTRNLWLKKIISVDEDCKKVLLLSNNQYLEEMEKIYIKPYCDLKYIQNK